MNSDMSTIYPSKLDTWLVVVLSAAGLAAMAACAVLLSAPVPGGWLVALPLLLIAVGLPTWLLSSTFYQFQGSELLVRSGPFRWRVPLRQISAVSNTRSPLSAPALSLDRILITFGTGQSIMVSPKDKQGFLRELKTRRERAPPSPLTP